MVRGIRRIARCRVRGAVTRLAHRDETEYLLASPANARRLREALADAKAGKGMRFTSVDELRKELLVDADR